MNDEGFREIQLNGKQLVFLFMAATVVSVVIFLCGVLVGRGVRDNGSSPATTSREITPDREVTAVRNASAPPAVSAPSGAAASSGATPPAEELSYAERLLRDTPPEEKLVPAPATPVREPMQVQSPPADRPRQDPPASAVRAPAVAPDGAPRAAFGAANPSGPGFAVQVAAYRDRREADTLAKQLVAKGYPAFVMDPVKGTPTALFRVRVGKYKTLKDAEAVSARLQSSEQFNTAWIAR